jgi:hypothetical protein
LMDVTMRAEPVLHVLTWVVGLLWSRHPPSGSLDMLCRAGCRWATRSAFIRYIYSSLLKAFYPLVDLPLMHVRAPYCANIRRWISSDLTPSAHRKRTAAHCSSMVQSLSGAAILLPSLLSDMWLNNGMLRAASYTSSLAHMWCCASAPLSCFYHAIS